MPEQAQYGRLYSAAITISNPSGQQAVASFADHFSGHASDYARYRPSYPAALFAWLAGISPATDLAWDCACGNGQAAVALAQHFNQVVATDASENQVHNAIGSDGVTYRVATAEQSGLDSDSVDLITVAQALHWFDLDAFYREARRVLKPGGILAVWSYGLTRIRPDIDAIVHYLYDDLVGAYWPMERKFVETGYAELPFPFNELKPQSFAMNAEWTLEQLTGYLRTWSAVKRYIADQGADPVSRIEPALAEAWDNSQTRMTLRWPLNLRVGAAD
jgi:SAM-dependent methyltransferase